LRPYILIALMFSCSLAAQTGWRMDGYDTSRTNHSKPIGPAVLPTFQALIPSEPSAIWRIAPDGSLISYDGNTSAPSPADSILSSFTSNGVLCWRVSIPFRPFFSGTDVAIAPDGTVYTVNVYSLDAWNRDTGAASWPSPVLLHVSGDSGTTLSIDSAANIYVATENNLIAPEKLIRVSPNGTIQWDDSFDAYSIVRQVSSTDESLLYFEFRGLNASSGNVLHTANFIASIFAPWGVIYGAAGLFSGGIVACSPDLTSCQSFGATGESTAAVLGPDTLLVNGPQDQSGGFAYLRAYSSHGTPLWTKPGHYLNIFSDAAGTVFARATDLNDVVALDGSSGTELWRQHFSNPPLAILLGDDGSLYINICAEATCTSGSTLYKSGGTTPIGTPNIVWPLNGSTALASALTMQWTPVAGATKYSVYFGSTPGSLSLYATVDAPRVRYPVYDLSPGTTYSWRVAASNGSATPSSPVASFATAGQAPPFSAPALVWPLNGSTAADVSLKVKWTAVSGASHYQVYFGTSAASLSPYSIVNVPLVLAAFYNLTPGTTYYWQVAAVAGTQSARSAVWSFTIPSR
jgi:hypothetical protein